MRSCRAFWDSRPCITAAEIDMLVALGDGPLCAEALALKLRRDPCSTQELLDALVSVGVLERCGERYAAAPATLLYCQSLVEGRLPPAEYRDA